MPKLTSKQVDELLATPVIARLATVREDGASYIVPVWQHWDDVHHPAEALTIRR
jgi:nitroimidazol reductase NimA-like FMN-containing flavoprotein (pyridoxamine 5'-phosphate oxidase superfamily)